jgi:hypothetical protein
MKKILSVIAVLLITNQATAQHEQHQAPDSGSTQAKPKSPRLSAMAMIGGNHVHIDYGSPSVRGRQIWNGLVAYNQVWAAGAHKATSIDFSKDVMIQGKHLPKGKYGFFVIPDKKEWVLIISKTWDMHLADDYNAANDIIRINVAPKKNAALIESLTYEVIETDVNTGNIKLSWEQLNVGFDFKNM